MGLVDGIAGGDSAELTKTVVSVGLGIPGILGNLFTILAIEHQAEVVELYVNPEVVGGAPFIAANVGIAIVLGL